MPNHVSIHAPARGATSLLPGRRNDYPVSIHAPARGATAVPDHCLPLYAFQSTRPRGARPIITVCPLMTYRFNPRARAGRDLYPYCAGFGDICFNPRARAGRDRRGWGRCMLITGFQSTRPRGARLIEDGEIHRYGKFQSTRPRGARLSNKPTVLTTMRFNPRARAGRDSNYNRPGQCHSVSIHAPARGATKLDMMPAPLFSSFNPRARAGRDLLSFTVNPSIQRFNPRARAGRDALSMLNH